MKLVKELIVSNKKCAHCRNSVPSGNYEWLVSPENPVVIDPVKDE